MDAPAEQCAFCGNAAVHRHHLTGRDPDRSYLDPELVAHLCHQHHVLVHNDLRSQQIDVSNWVGWGPVAGVAYALRRLALFLGRFATYADNPLWQQMAIMLEQAAATVAEHATTGDFLDEC